MCSKRKDTNARAMAIPAAASLHHPSCHGPTEPLESTTIENLADLERHVMLVLGLLLDLSHHV